MCISFDEEMQLNVEIERHAIMKSKGELNRTMTKGVHCGKMRSCGRWFTVERRTEEDRNRTRKARCG
jgi:hypothetical protein